MVRTFTGQKFDHTPAQKLIFHMVCSGTCSIQMQQRLKLILKIQNEVGSGLTMVQ